MDVIVVAKVDPKKPSGTILTVEHFKEIVRFEEWLYRLEYPIVPGIPRGSRYKEPPQTLTWYDLCKKEKVYLKAWPEGTPDECRLIPSQCPEIKAPTRQRCRPGNSPLDFVYENKIKDYNFRKYSTDEDLVKKIRTGKGDETFSKWDGLGEVLYVKLIFGSTQPTVVE